MARQGPAVIDQIYQLFDSVPLLAESASEAIHRLLTVTTSEELVGLDDLLRRLYSWDLPPRWLRLQPGDVAALPKTEASRTSVLGLASFHANGYVREQAVRLLADVPEWAGLPFLLIRLNDWVTNVRTAAREAIEPLLQVESVGPIFRNLALVLHLAECSRVDHSDLVETVLRRLLEPGHLPDLLEVVRCGRRSVAQGCFRRSIAIPGPHRSALIRAGLLARDSVLRLYAARHLATVEQGVRLEETLSSLDVDRAMSVRREALQIRLDHLPQTAEPALEKALLDGKQSVREFARFYLGRIRPVDFPAYYRVALSADTHRPQAIAGLGETGTSADAPHLFPFLTASESRIRHAAVRAIGRLAGAEHAGLLMERLTDESPRVVREAQQALQGHPACLDPAQLWRIFLADHRIHVRLAVLALLNHTGSWGKLSYLIRAACDPDETIALRARSYAERRYNRVFTRPTEEESRRIEAAMTECATTLPPDFLTDLRSQLLLFRP